MRDLLKSALKLSFWLMLAAFIVILAAWLASIGVLSDKAAVIVIFSIPFLFCVVKVCSCVYLMKRGLPATGYFSMQTRLSHLRYCSADGIERKGSCDLLTRRALKKGRAVPVWYSATHPDRFTTGQNEIVVNAMFCVLFAIVPVYLLIRL